MGEKLGSPKMCEEAGMVRRNVSLNMIAPNKSTSFICGATSLGIEPFMSNYFVKALAGIQTTFKNPELKKLLKEKGHDTPEVWDSILNNLGSCQHLECLTDEEKAPFKTAYEISPKDMIDMVADRQPYIDMGQSFNLFGRPNYNLKDVYDIHKYAWSRGIKTLYYWYSAHAALEKNGDKWDSCESCAD
jgi:ribonucleoside-diphosphate reductase alpha chain